MENFNKNWLVILLIAVVFGILGYLLGTVNHSGCHSHHRYNHEMKCKDHHNCGSHCMSVYGDKDVDVDVNKLIDEAVENGDTGKVVVIKKVIK